jgi:hypothetical protein
VLREFRRTSEAGFGRIGAKQMTAFQLTCVAAAG